MKIPIAKLAGLLILTPFVPAHIVGQQPTPPKSPIEVMRAYREMDAKGGRLTKAGWYQAGKFFVRAAHPPRNQPIAVLETERVTEPASLKGISAEVVVACYAIGTIDAAGKFGYNVAGRLVDRGGRPVWIQPDQGIYGPVSFSRAYNLVLTDTHWEFGPDRKLREVKGPPEWRMQYFEFEPWVTVQTAIRYLTRLRDTTTNEAVKNNATKSIATLRRHL